MTLNASTLSAPLSNRASIRPCPYLISISFKKVLLLFFSIKPEGFVCLLGELSIFDEREVFIFSTIILFGVVGITSFGVEKKLLKPRTRLRIKKEPI